MAGVSVFIVNYNGARFIEACIDSVLASRLNVPLEVIVVDNQSSDNSLDVLLGYKGRIKIIKNYHNSGFSKGNNIAAQYAEGDYFFLLNNDTVLPEDTLQKMYDYMIQHHTIGALVPKLLNEDGTLQCPGSVFGRWRFYSQQPVDVPFVAGAALLMSKQVYSEINGLDENLFFYNDDVDLCKVLLKRKLRIVYFPSAELTHFGGLSTKFRKLGSLVEGYRGGFYVCRKHYGKIAFFLYRWVVLIDILPRLCVHVLRSLFQKSQRQYVQSYMDVLKINISGNIYVDHPNVKVDLL